MLHTNTEKVDIVVSSNICMPASLRTKYKICVVHNYYQWPGGEDRVFSDDISLLKKNGHYVCSFTRHNDAIKSMHTLSVGLNTIWSRSSSNELGRVLRHEEPDVVHFHNTFPLVSPAAYYAAHRQGAAVVQTLHNFRLICPAATLLRDGLICEKCVGQRLYWPAMLYRCYKNSLRASATLTAMLNFHRILGTWSKTIDAYIALTEFSKSKFVEGGLPSDRIHVKSNYCDDLNRNLASSTVRIGGLFVGRLSEEKGIQTMLRAWAPLKEIPLKVIGDGPLAGQLKKSPQILFLGPMSNEKVRDAMCRAAFLVLPSEWYEGFPLVIAEAYSQGLPVIGSRIGGLPELIEHKFTGLLFNPGDADDLTEKILWASANETKLREMGTNARNIYLKKYTPQTNYPQLMEVYEKAICRRRSANTSRTS